MLIRQSPIILFAFSKYFLDMPDSSRKLHKIPVPYTGGFLIIANIIFLLFLFLYFNISFLSDNNLLLKHADSKRFVFCLFILPILFFLDLELLYLELILMTLHIPILYLLQIF